MKRPHYQMQVRIIMHLSIKVLQPVYFIPAHVAGSMHMSLWHSNVSFPRMQVMPAMAEARIEEGKKLETDWQKTYDEWKGKYPEEVRARCSLNSAAAMCSKI